MISSIITLGDKITLQKADEEKQYVSSVLDLEQEELLHIGMPMENSQIIPLDLEEEYQICFYTKRGLYQCYGEVIDRYKEGTLLVVVIKMITELERFQRRKYYRIEKILDIKYRVLLEEEEDEPYNCLEEELYEKAVLTDISGGGVRFHSSQFHQKNTKIIVKITLDTSQGERDYALRATIVACEEMIHRPGIYENRAEFYEINVSEREAIIKFVFEEERKQRRREKGLM